MRTLLHRLVTAHVLLDRGDWAKPYHDDHCAPASHTFLGVCKVEGVSPVARRVDVKIYPSTMRVCGGGCGGVRACGEKGVCAWGCMKRMVS